MSGRLITIFCAVNFLGLILLCYFQFIRSSEKIAYIDSARVINSYQGMVKARAEYQGKVAVWKANIDTLAKEVQEQLQKFQSESPRMSSREKELTKQLVQSKQQQLAEYQRAIGEKANTEDALATKKVIDEINAYIKVYGEEHHFKIILAATEQGSIAFAEKHLDITDKIIEGLNNKYVGSNVK